MHQLTTPVDYRRQNHKKPGSELANEYEPRLLRNLIRSGHSERDRDKPATGHNRLGAYGPLGHDFVPLTVRLERATRLTT